MSRTIDVYDRFDRSTTPGFVVRAFFPWVFVVLMNLAIYETLVPDGRSVISWFSELEIEDLQLYAALFVIVGLAAVAAVSDGIVEMLIRPHRFAGLCRRLGSYRGKNKALIKSLRKTLEDDRVSPGARFDTACLQLLRGMDPQSIELVTGKIEEARTATHLSAILVIGFATSIVLTAVEFFRFQSNILVAAGVIFALWVLMIAALLLARRQLEHITALDGALIDWASEAK